MVPILDYVIYPSLLRVGVHFIPIKRMYAGFISAGLAMLYAAVLEPRRNNRPSVCVGPDKQPLHADINVWVIAVPYILIGLAEIFVRKSFRTSLNTNM